MTGDPLLQPQRRRRVKIEASLPSPRSLVLLGLGLAGMALGGGTSAREKTSTRSIGSPGTAADEGFASTLAQPLDHALHGRVLTSATTTRAPELRGASTATVHAASPTTYTDLASHNRVMPLLADIFNAVTGTTPLDKLAVIYLDHEQRAAYKVSVVEGRLVDARGKRVDTQHCDGGIGRKGMADVVMDELGTIYMDTEHSADPQWKHTTFLAGGKVAFAGEIFVKDGVAELGNPNSGHYLTTHPQLLQFEDRLHKLGATQFKAKAYDPLNLYDRLPGPGTMAATVIAVAGTGILISNRLKKNKLWATLETLDADSRELIAHMALVDDGKAPRVAAAMARLSPARSARAQKRLIEANLLSQDGSISNPMLIATLKREVNFGPSTGPLRRQLQSVCDLVDGIDSNSRQTMQLQALTWPEDFSARLAARITGRSTDEIESELEKIQGAVDELTFNSESQPMPWQTAIEHMTLHAMPPGTAASVGRTIAAHLAFDGLSADAAALLRLAARTQGPIDLQRSARSIGILSPSKLQAALAEIRQAETKFAVRHADAAAVIGRADATPQAALQASPFIAAARSTAPSSTPAWQPISAPFGIAHTRQTRDPGWEALASSASAPENVPFDLQRPPR